MSVHCHQGRLGDCSSSGTTSGKRRGVQLSTEFRHSELSIAAAGTELAGIWWTNGWVWTELMPIHAYTLRFMSIFKLENDDETVDGMLLDNPYELGPRLCGLMSLFSWIGAWGWHWMMLNWTLRCLNWYFNIRSVRDASTVSCCATGCHRPKNADGSESDFWKPEGTMGHVRPIQDGHFVKLW